MTTIPLIEKRKNLERKKNRIKQQEAFLKALERKKRTRQLIALGGLVSKAQLEDWNANTLLGALLSLKEQESDARQLDEWAYKGGSVFSEGKRKRVSS